VSDELLVDNGDVTLRVDVTGDAAGGGATVLCVHGWPEVARSWRHQVAHLAAEGHRVAAMDVRGNGGSSAPPEPERYTLRELAGDVAAVAAALGDEPVVLLGHDWGAPIAWTTAIRHPDRVRAVAGLGVPHTPPLPFSIVDLLDQLYAGRFFYMLHFQEPGVMEAELGADLRDGLKRAYFALSGDAPAGSWLPDLARGTPFLPSLPTPPDGPLSFLTDDDLDHCTREIRRSGTTGGLNRYRATRFDPETSADIVGATVDQPACFIAGALDPVRHMVPGVDAYADPGAGCADLRGATIVEGAGHWVHQEAPAATNRALDAFIASL
jgi:pimeloyl-ACP methyl ester carboxylesterase